MIDGSRIPIIIVGYRNAADIRTCLSALKRARRKPSFSIFICENGGPDAFEALVASMSATGGPCAGETWPIDERIGDFVRVRRLWLATEDIAVFAAAAPENLGYAGGVNAWIRPLLRAPGWEGVWILNPDTKPRPDALAELVGHARRHGKGMVGSRLVLSEDPEVVRSRGLKWRKALASTLAVDMGVRVALDLPLDHAEPRIDAPSGASVYVSRACLEAIGLMDERFFLYYEDLDWGLRAKAAHGVGCADRSVVPTVGGTTIGSARRRADRSRLSVYLEFRNRLLFVRKQYPAWFAWTAAIALLRSSEYLAVGARANFLAALQGLYAGLRGETGRPDHIILAHQPPEANPAPT